MNNKNLKGSIGKLVIILIMVVIVIAGGTYALLSVSLNAINGQYMSGTSCFDIVYDITNEDGTSDITGVLFPSRNAFGGISGNASLSINSSCNLNGIGDLNLNVVTGSDILFQTVGAHCEDSRTLETMTDYTSEATCIAQDNGIWVTNGTALKYAIYDEDYALPVSVGYLNNTGTIDVLSDLWITPDKLEYDIFVWLDGNLSDETYINQPFSANVSASVEQINDDIQSYAVYSATDNSLRFYKDTELIAVGDTYTAKVNGVDTTLTATAVYTGIETSSYTSASTVPWYSYRENITTVVVENAIKPQQMRYWFYGFKNCVNFDVTKLNTSRVDSMGYTFYQAGYNVEDFKIIGLENWNTSSVTSMAYIFNSCGYNSAAFDLSNISDWDTSSVTNMYGVFNKAGYSSTTFIDMDLSKWNTSSVTSMGAMFQQMGAAAVSGLNLGDLSMKKVTKDDGTTYTAWDTSNVTGMAYMFYGMCGECTSLFTFGSLSNWNTSSVTNMEAMFSWAGGWANDNVKLDMGDLRKKTVTKSDGKTYTAWDTSNVTNMNSVFSKVRLKSTYSLDLSGWSVGKVTSYTNFDYGVEDKIISPWD